jgi:hypothetical protein
MAECDVLDRADVFKKSDERLVSGTSKGFALGADIQHPKPSDRGEFVTGSMALLLHSKHAQTHLREKTLLTG